MFRQIAENQECQWKMDEDGAGGNLLPGGRVCGREMVQAVNAE